MRRSSQGMMGLSYDADSGRRLLARYAKAKPRPSKWDDAQRWLSSSRAHDDDDRRRSSCADDRLLLPSASQKARHSWSAADGGAALPAALGLGARDDAGAEAETKRVDSVLAYGQPPRCPSLRDVGTEMTPAGSKEPSRANTPRATLPATPPSTAGRAIHAPLRPPDLSTVDGGSPPGLAAADRDETAPGAPTTTAVSPAATWDAAERAKHMAR
nr:unknown [Zea mays]